MSAEKVKMFFEHVVVSYNCEDVGALLDIDLDKAGPLLSCVVNGFDLVGGMMLGFDKGSQKRSVAFLTKHMRLSPESANLLYSLVRCGVAHEGVAKLAVNYFVYHRRLEPGIILYKKNDKSLWLNVTEMARLYLESIREIAKDVSSHLFYIPSAKRDDEAIFLAALDSIQPDINAFCELERERVQLSGSGGPLPLQAEWLSRLTFRSK